MFKWKSLAAAFVLGAFMQLGTPPPVSATFVAPSDTVAQVRIPTAAALPGTEAQVILLATIPEGVPVYGFFAQIGFDPNLVSYENVDRNGTLVDGCSIAQHLISPSSLRIASACIDSIGTQGILIKINFSVHNDVPIGTTIPIQFESFYFNEGDPPSVTTDGSIYVGTTTGIAHDSTPLFSIGPVPMRQGVPTCFHFQNWSASKTTIEIFDLKGRRLMRVEPSLREKGETSIPLTLDDGRAHELPAGVYFYRVHADQNEYRGKFTVLR